MTERRSALRGCGGGRGRTAPDRLLAGGALCLVLLTALASCSTADGSTRSTPTGTTATSTPAPSEAASASGQTAADLAMLADAARTAGTPLRSGEVTLTVAAVAMPITADEQDDGSVDLTFTVAAAGGSSTAAPPRRVIAVLAAPSGMRFEARPDRSVAVLSGTGTGTVIGALPPVVVVDGTGVRRGAAMAAREADATLLDVLVDAGPAGSASLTLGATPLVSARWGEREGGRSLAVVPAAWVRRASLAAQDALWSALVAAEPDADSTTMRDQLRCHALGAPDKASWNLEPWRPEVDPISLLASGCNP